VSGPATSWLTRIPRGPCTGSSVRRSASRRNAWLTRTIRSEASHTTAGADGSRTTSTPPGPNPSSVPGGRVEVPRAASRSAGRMRGKLPTGSVSSGSDPGSANPGSVNTGSSNAAGASSGSATGAPANPDGPAPAPTTCIGRGSVTASVSCGAPAGTSSWTYSTARGAALGSSCGSRPDERTTPPGASEIACASWLANRATSGRTPPPRTAWRERRRSARCTASAEVSSSVPRPWSSRRVSPVCDDCSSNSSTAPPRRRVPNPRYLEHNEVVARSIRRLTSNEPRRPV
jgi:hypothetical protein